jgi:tRNA A-37 threonylcarbamoyl transferase component Bud32
VSALAGCVREETSQAVTLVRGDLAEGARALGLFGADALARLERAGRRAAGGRGGVAVIAWPGAGREIVVRVLRHGGLLGALLGGAYTSPRRVLHELDVTSELFAAGAPVPRPAFALARRHGWRWACAIGTERASGRELAAEVSGPARADALTAAATAVRAFHDRGGEHADLNATNVLVRESAGAFAATLLDLDRARVAAPVPTRRMREIARLWRSLAKLGTALSAPEREAFLHAYCAGDVALRRALRAAARRERLRSALHAWRYPRR